MKHEGIITDHGVIRSTGDLNRLDIIDFNRYYSHWEDPQHCLEVVTSHLVGLTYSVITVDLYQYPERDDFPGWQHAGNHESAGKQFWNYFHYTFKGTLNFHDRPDFSGTILHDETTQSRFVGDIGKVSPISMMDSMSSRRGGLNRLWVSVSSNCRKLTILEPTSVTDDLQLLRQKLTPILKQNTAHILHGNVFIEQGRDNVYIGDHAELTDMSASHLKKRINAALAGTWNRQPIPLS